MCWSLMSQTSDVTVTVQFLVGTIKMYLHLSSIGEGVYKSENKWYNFRATLPSYYFFNRSESWCVGLVQFYVYNRNGNEIDLNSGEWQTKSNIPLRVCCDLAESMSFSDYEEQLLCITRLKDCSNSIFYPNNTVYVPLSKERVNTIHLYISLDQSTVPPLDHGVSSVVLEIKRMDQ